MCYDCNRQKSRGEKTCGVCGSSLRRTAAERKVEKVAAAKRAKQNGVRLTFAPRPRTVVEIAERQHDLDQHDLDTIVRAVPTVSADGITTAEIQYLHRRTG